MRHRVYGKHLSRDKNERAALRKSLVSSLFIHGSIQTTDQKAKTIKGTVDKIINEAKQKTSQNLIQALIVSKDLREKLVNEIAPKMKNRNSGYTSIIKLGRRVGDGAMTVRMSLVEEISKGLPEKKLKTQKSNVKTTTQNSKVEEKEVVK